jgi:hypothetical protein
VPVGTEQAFEAAEGIAVEDVGLRDRALGERSLERGGAGRDIVLAGCAIAEPEAGRLQAHTRVVLAVPARAPRQSITSPPRPAVRITVGEPSPMQTKWIWRPSGNLTESAVLT